MEQCNSTLPEGKKVTCLEDLGLLSMKDIRRYILDIRYYFKEILLYFVLDI